MSDTAFNILGIVYASMMMTMISVLFISMMINSKKQNKKQEPKPDPLIDRIRYNKEFTDYLKHITTEITIIEFKKMLRSIKDISVTNMRTLTIEHIEVVAKLVYEHLDKELMDSGLLLSKDFYSTYIIDITTVTMEKLISEMGDRYE